MKKTYLWIMLIGIITIFIISCAEKGDTGPQGPAGESGSNGEEVYVAMFQNGVYPDSNYTGIKDTYLNSNSLNNNSQNENNGICQALPCGFYTSYGIYRILIKADISLLSSTNVKIKKAYIVFYVWDLWIKGINTITAYKVISDWDEGDACGSTGTAATWNERKPGISWSTPGGDYGEIASNSMIVVEGETSGYIQFEIKPETVQEWIDNPSNNYGLIFKADVENSTSDNALDVFSSQNSTAMRPKLIIYYTYN